MLARVGRGVGRLRGGVGRLRGWLGAMAPAMLAGGFFALGIRIAEPQESRFGLLLLGVLYGTAVLGLIRLFRIAPWAYFLAGMLAGPVPMAFLAGRGRGNKAEEMQGMWLLLIVLGAIIGLLETARVQRSRSREEGT